MMELLTFYLTNHKKRLLLQQCRRVSILKIMVVDDHIALGEGTQAILQMGIENSQVDVFTEPTHALQQLSSERYDVYVIDFHLKDMNGLTFVEQLVKIHPKAVAIIYTGHNIEQHIPDLLEKGIIGFINKTESKKRLIDTVQYAYEGNVIIPLDILRTIIQNKKIFHLTERQRKIMELAKKGAKNKEIASELYVSQRTVEKDLTQIFSKLNVMSRVEAISKWSEFE